MGDIFENMKIETYSNKIEKWGICDFKDRNSSEVSSKEVIFVDLFLIFWKKIGEIRNSSFQSHLIGWDTYNYTTTLKIKKQKQKKQKNSNKTLNYDFKIG